MLTGLMWLKYVNKQNLNVENKNYENKIFENI